MDIQVIDFKAADADKQFARALQEIGFAVVKNHSVDPELMRRAEKEWYDFFMSQEKHDFPFRRDTHDGFAGMEQAESAKGFEKPDLKEMYHYYRQGGYCPEHLKPVTEAMYDSLENLACTLLDWVEAGTPEEIRTKFSMPLADMVRDCPKTLFRILHYPPLTGNEPAGMVRAAEHGDINMLTMLPAANAEGLQVRGKDGQWIKAPHGEDWIIVNIGDMLEACSENFYPSTRHRVVNPVGDAAKQSRISMPLFLHAHGDVKLSDKYTADSYRAERYKELGLD